MLDRLDGADDPGVVVLGHLARPTASIMAASSSARATHIAKMVEYKDATEAERAVNLCNSGMMAVALGRSVSAGSAQVGNDNAAGEYYLPDIVMIAARRRPRARR